MVAPLLQAQVDIKAPISTVCVCQRLPPDASVESAVPLDAGSTPGTPAPAPSISTAATCCSGRRHPLSSR